MLVSSQFLLSLPSCVRSSSMTSCILLTCLPVHVIPSISNPTTRSSCFLHLVFRSPLQSSPTHPPSPFSHRLVFRSPLLAFHPTTFAPSCLPLTASILSLPHPHLAPAHQPLPIAATTPHPQPACQHPRIHTPPSITSTGRVQHQACGGCGNCPPTFLLSPPCKYHDLV
ncbi:hypothetical protein Pcinc_032862 [Petrolisthes cinctipes]|uniref:Uncharacterized protein n=1 Tax=Petrolisthes cinctipes TaxID=88211 RepID=A0AAE1ETJ8_PETCI|nr:hypothetical protein Pcinc_032862 [Petrolisthes cinctipes]